MYMSTAVIVLFVALMLCLIVAAVLCYLGWEAALKRENETWEHAQRLRKMVGYAMPDLRPVHPDNADLNDALQFFLREEPQV